MRKELIKYDWSQNQVSYATAGGFLDDDDDNAERFQRSEKERSSQDANTSAAGGSAPDECAKCAKPLIDSFLWDKFNEPVCDTCRSVSVLIALIFGFLYVPRVFGKCYFCVAFIARFVRCEGTMFRRMNFVITPYILAAFVIIRLYSTQLCRLAFDCQITMEKLNAILANCNEKSGDNTNCIDFFVLYLMLIFSRKPDGEHKLITRTEAKTQYMLKDCDFDMRKPPLRFISKKNPHNPRYGDMKLYLKAQVCFTIEYQCILVDWSFWSFLIYILSSIMINMYTGQLRNINIARNNFMFSNNGISVSLINLRQKFILKHSCAILILPPSFELLHRPQFFHWLLLKHNIVYFKIEARVLEVFGSWEALEAAKEQRVEQREVRRDKRFEKKIKELRNEVRGDSISKASKRKSHEHEYGDEQHDSSSDEYFKICTICGYRLSYEKLWLLRRTMLQMFLQLLIACS